MTPLRSQLIIRFDTRAHLVDWMKLQTRARLIENARPLLVMGDDFFYKQRFGFLIHSGGSEGEGAGMLETVPGHMVSHLSAGTRCAANRCARSAAPWRPNKRFLTIFVVTETIVTLMVYVIMPRYTKLIQRWLSS
jgi:hypothetical protein